MDWRSVRFDWNRARAFLVTAEEGSLSAAARALDMSQPTLGRQVSALEEELGVALFERGARSLELTPAGLDLIRHVRQMGDAASQLSLSASGRSASIEGSICITATEVMAAYVLPPIMADLRRSEPLIDVEIIASNSSSDLKRREADIAVRSYRPIQTDLIAKKLGDVPWSLYATPEYLASIGSPANADEFCDADFIGFDRTDMLIDAYGEVGLKLGQEDFPLITENHLVHWELVKAGAAIGVMPTALGDVEDGVVRVLPDAEPPMSELWLAAHRELRTSRRVRTVFEFLADALLARLWEHEPPRREANERT